MSKPICFVCGRGPTDAKDFEYFVETDDGHVCPECAGEDDSSDIINEGQIWPISDESEISEVEKTDVHDL